MSETAAGLTPRLREIVDDFALAEGQEKLELLLDFARQMPALPAHVQRTETDQVHECMTPVFVYADADAHGMHYYFDIPPESPTVRGYASLLSAGVDGASPEAVLQVPSSFWEPMGLAEVLTPRRLQGATAILAHMKRLASQHLTVGGNA